MSSNPISNVEILGTNATFEQIPLGGVSVDIFKVKDLARTTVNVVMNRADARIAGQIPDRRISYYSTKLT